MLFIKGTSSRDAVSKTHTEQDTLRLAELLRPGYYMARDAAY